MNLSTDFRKKHSNTKFHDYPSCGTEFFRAVGRTETRRIVAFRNSTNTPNKKQMMQPVETSKNQYRKSGDIWYEASVL